MEQRKAYIITGLIVIGLITSLSVWYFYLTQQESTSKLTTDVLYDTSGGSFSGGFYEDMSDAETNPERTQQSPQEPEDTVATSSSTSTPEKEPEVWNMVQITTEPTTQAVLTSSSTAIYVERKTGHIYQNTNFNKERISGITLTRIEHSLVLNDTQVLLIPEGAAAELITLGDATTTYTFTEPVISPVLNQDNVYYLTPLEIGVALREFIPSTKSITTIWESELRGWTLENAQSGSFLLTQTPSQNIPGYAYLFTITDRTLMPVLSDMPGLMARMSPDGSRTIYSTSQRETELYLKTPQTTQKLTIKTLADKCRWGSDSINLYCAIPETLPKGLPDSWLKGVVHTNDSLWRIDTNSGEATLLAQDTGLDIINIDEQDSLVIFNNKKDQSLWSVVRN